MKIISHLNTKKYTKMTVQDVVMVDRKKNPLALGSFLISIPLATRYEIFFSLKCILVAILQLLS